ncbi:MAG: hypothetical protein CMH55_03650 [Myxococcales bacterium]|nr:hypothetical protein [Myxococcales bacterium]
MVLGEAFPAMEATPSPTLPEPLRTRYADPAGVPGGIGTEEAPFEDLQVALRALEPGDRLVVKKGVFRGHFAVDDLCQRGEEDAPIQVIAEPGATLTPGDDQDVPVLRLNRSHWMIQGLDIDAESRVDRAVHVAGIASNSPASHVILAGLRATGARRVGIAFGPDLRSSKLINAQIDNNGDGDNAADGLRIYGNVDGLELAGLRVHDNSADGLHLPNHRDPPAGFEDRPLGAPTDLSIHSSRFHDNGDDGLELRDGREVEVQALRVWNHLQRENSACIKIQGAVTDAQLENNHLAECTRALWIGQGVHDAVAEALVPNDVLVMRNYMVSQLATRTSGLVLTTVKDVRVYHNIISQYDSGLTIHGDEFENRDIQVRNNLFHEHEVRSFNFTVWENVDRFDYNAFARGSGAAEGRVGNEQSSVLDWINGGRLADSILAEAVSFMALDLGNVSGINLVDRGVPIAGIPIVGSAPDIGIAEK